MSQNALKSEENAGVEKQRRVKGERAAFGRLVRMEKKTWVKVGENGSMLMDQWERRKEGSGRIRSLSEDRTLQRRVEMDLAEKRSSRADELFQAYDQDR